MYRKSMFLFLVLLIFCASNGIEFKLKQPKPDKYRCAYKKYFGENDGEFLYQFKESATACLDELPQMEGESLCENIFERNEGELRPEACDNEWIQPLAKKCRKTCGTCCELPEFQCKDKETIECNEIEGILSKRHSTNLWRPILLDHCPSAAGLCKEFKEKKEEEEKKKKEEERSKGGGWLLPIEGDCRDAKSESYCASRTSNCNKKIILRRCRKTCGDCLPESYVCKNKEKHKRRCKLWAANGFCRRDKKNKFSLGVILKYCPLTCGLCKNEEKEERRKRKNERREEGEKKMMEELERERGKRRKMREESKLRKMVGEEKEKKEEEEEKKMKEEKKKRKEEMKELEEERKRIEEEKKKLEEMKEEFEEIKKKIKEEKEEIEEEKRKLEEEKKKLEKEKAIMEEVKKGIDEEKARKKVENEGKLKEIIEKLKAEKKKEKEEEEKEKEEQKRKRNTSI